MVISCSAFGCTNRHKKGDAVSFHTFPKDKDMRAKWVIATKRKNFVPTSASRLCSDHFESTDFIVRFGQKKVAPNAVPSIFKFPEHLQKTKKSRRSSPKRRTEVEVSEKAATGGTAQEVVDDVGDLMQNVDTPTPDEPPVGQSMVPEASILVEVPKEKVPSMKFPCSPNRRQPCHFRDFKEKHLKSPQKVKKMWLLAAEIIKKKEKTIKLLRNKTYRLQKKVKSLKDLLTHLKTSQRISDNCYSVLQDCVPVSVQQILLKQMKISREKKYAEELRTFALTLNFYSNSAYKYVRKTFGNCLPHPKTLQKWYRSVDGSPGYTSESLRALELKKKESENNGKPLVCSLIMDEVNIKQDIQWRGDRQVGYINYGFPNMDSDSLPAAKDAIVFLLVGVNSRWKLPVGYFLINGLSANEKANLVNGCLTMVHRVGVIITSLTFDGAAANLTMAQILGASLCHENLKPFFDHPITKEPIYIILDPCHMIKLIRNALGDWSCFLNEQNESVKWVYFTSLVEIQEKTGLHAATKIRRRHLNYKKEIRKVKLAVQTFSNSVADALDFCSEDMKLKQFDDVRATAQFCRVFNDLFDVMNTRNALSKQTFKKPLSLINKGAALNLFKESRRYIENLKDGQGNKLLLSRRKTGFLGMLVNMASIEGILEYHMTIKNNLKYLLTYKLSQDHLEMFFSSIRSMGGFTNNPTALQFESAYKKILVHTELTTPESANCLAQDETSILKISSASSKSNFDELDSIMHFGKQQVEGERDNFFFLDNKSIFENNIIEYIAGFVVKKLLNTLNCNICTCAITSWNSFSLLLNRKNRGGLKKASADVVMICRIAEKVFRSFPGFSTPNVMPKLIMETTRYINFSKIFRSLNDHILDQDPMNNHLIQLVYQILKIYFNIRLRHENKSLDEAKLRIRHMYTKLIHFKHQ